MRIVLSQTLARPIRSHEPASPASLCLLTKAPVLVTLSK